MFALPNSKRVGRDELDSPSSSRASSVDPDILAKLRERTQFDLIEATQPVVGSSAREAEDGDDDDVELAFNLFAPTTSTNTNNTATGNAPTITEQKIRLRSPTPLEDSNPGFVVPNRPDQTYYFTGPISASKLAEYNSSAVEGSTILNDWSRRPSPGCAYPWKIISLPATASKVLAPTLNPVEEKFLPDGEDDEEEKPRKRARLGKKARIKKRVKAEKTRVRKEEAEKNKEEKEKAEREKRARRNREKKFKKRARDKAKKAAGGGGTARSESGMRGEGSDGENGSDSEGEGEE